MPMHECVFTKARHNLEKLEPTIGLSIFLPAHTHTHARRDTQYFFVSESWLKHPVSGLQVRARMDRGQ